MDNKKLQSVYGMQMAELKDRILWCNAHLRDNVYKAHPIGVKEETSFMHIESAVLQVRKTA